MAFTLAVRAFFVDDPIMRWHNIVSLRDNQVTHHAPSPTPDNFKFISHYLALCIFHMKHGTPHPIPFATNATVFSPKQPKREDNNNKIEIIICIFLFFQCSTSVPLHSYILCIDRTREKRIGKFEKKKKMKWNEIIHWSTAARRHHTFSRMKSIWLNLFIKLVLRCVA